MRGWWRTSPHIWTPTSSTGPPGRSMTSSGANTATGILRWRKSTSRIQDPGSVDFRHLKIPVAVFAPDEVIERPGGPVELVGVQMCGDVLHQPRIPAADPAVGGGKHRRGRCRGAGVELSQVHQHEARRVPDLRAEVP